MNLEIRQRRSCIYNLHFVKNTRLIYDSRRQFGIFARLVRAKLLLDCYTVAALQMLQTPPTPRPSRVRYTNRPLGHQRSYTKRPTIRCAILMARAATRKWSKKLMSLGRPREFTLRRIHYTYTCNVVRVVLSVRPAGSSFKQVLSPVMASYLSGRIKRRVTRVTPGRSISARVRPSVCLPACFLAPRTLGTVR